MCVTAGSQMQTRTRTKLHFYANSLTIWQMSNTCTRENVVSHGRGKKKKNACMDHLRDEAWWSIAAFRAPPHLSEVYTSDLHKAFLCTAGTVFGQVIVNTSLISKVIILLWGFWVKTVLWEIGVQNSVLFVLSCSISHTFVFRILPYFGVSCTYFEYFHILYTSVFCTLYSLHVGIPHALAFHTFWYAVHLQYSVHAVIRYISYTLVFRRF